MFYCELYSLRSIVLDSIVLLKLKQDLPGCFYDNNIHHDLTGHYFDDKQMTREMCIQKCVDLDFAYAGVQYA